VESLLFQIERPWTPIYISHPFISVIGSIQNGILDELAKDDRTNNGFIDRILFAIPNNLKKPYWSENEISEEIISSYHSIIGMLLNLPCDAQSDGTPIANILKLEEPARKRLFEWQRHNTNLCNQAENESIAGKYSKLEIYVPRFSLILQMISWACGEGGKDSISLKSMEGAIKMGEYFRKSAVKVNQIISEANPVDKLPRNKAILYDLLPGTFRTQEGIETADKVGIPERTFKEFLNDRGLFDKIKQGYYEKRL